MVATALLMAVAALGATRFPPPARLSRRAASIGGGCAAVLGRRLFPAPPALAAAAPPLCDADVSVLTSSSGRQFVIVGTAHVSKESATLVRQVIRYVRPDTVMVELDRRRANQLMRKAKARERGELVVASSAIAPPGEQSRGAAFYKSLDNMGFPAGGEFVAAIEEARLLNATILLGDQDFNVTSQRLKEAQAEVRRLRAEGIISREDAKAAADRVPSSLRSREGGAPLTADSVAQMTTDLKQRENARAVVAYLKEAAPPVYDAMIGERDLHMAHALEAAAGNSIVAVVGLSHLEGIERILAEEVEVRPRSCTLPPSLGILSASR